MRPAFIVPFILLVAGLGAVSPSPLPAPATADPVGDREERVAADDGDGVRESARPERRRRGLSASVDLDSDGAVEEIELLNYEPFESSTTEGRFALSVSRVIGGERRVIWRDAARRHPFRILPGGVEEIVLAADIDGDGRVELASQCLRSDVGPGTFRVFRWKRGAVALVRRASLVGDRRGEGRFTWREPARRDRPRWAVAWLTGCPSPGVIEAELVADPGSGLRRGPVLLKAEGDGYRLVEDAGAPRRDPPGQARP